MNDRAIFYCPSCGEDRMQHGKEPKVYLCENCFACVRIEFADRITTEVQECLYRHAVAVAKELGDGAELVSSKGGDS